MLKRINALICLLTPWLLVGCGWIGSEAVPRPNVVLILIDALRKDHLHLYGYKRKTSPAIDRLGESGWVFENHIAQASQTVPSTLSLMLSQYPVEHGFVHRTIGQFGHEPPYFPESLVFLSEVFRVNGYQTAGFVANPFLGEKNGFQQGFGHFVHWEDEGAAMTAEVEKWLSNHTGSDDPPFFLYVHFMDVHNPYEPPEEYARKYAPEGGSVMYRNGVADGTSPAVLAYTIAMYDAGINYVDDQVARIVDTMSSLNLLERTLFALTSDHRDEFLEHGGLGHGTTVYGELVRVPLVIAYPPELQPGKRIRHLSQHLDVGPTLLHLAGLKKPPSFRGVSVLAPAQRAYSEGASWRAVYGHGKKLVLNKQSGEASLFDATDQLDQHPLEDTENEEYRELLMSYLHSYLGLEAESRQTPEDGEPARQWNKEELERLKALGYVR